jgi:hypothetical protein
MLTDPFLSTCMIISLGDQVLYYNIQTSGKGEDKQGWGDKCIGVV